MLQYLSNWAPSPLQVPGHSREVSGGQNGEGIGSLVRLVEALEMYDNGAMESYMTEDSMESAALMKGNHKQKVGGFL